MADDLTLQLDPRTQSRKQVKVLRREGIVPANIYGRGLDSVAVQAPLREWQRVFRAVDRNSIVNVQVDGEGETRPVLLREVQRHPVSREVLHLDLYQVDVTRPIHAEARIVFVGQAEAVVNGGVLVHGIGAIALEALPLEMLSEIEVDVSGLSDFGMSISVADLELPEGIRVLTDPSVAVVSALAPRVEEEEEEEALLEGEELELAEGEEPPEGAPAEGAEEEVEGDDA